MPHSQPDDKVSFFEFMLSKCGRNVFFFFLATVLHEKNMLFPD